MHVLFKFLAQHEGLIIIINITIIIRTWIELNNVSMLFIFSCQDTKPTSDM